MNRKFILFLIFIFCLVYVQSTENQGENDNSKPNSNEQVDEISADEEEDESLNDEQVDDDVNLEDLIDEIEELTDEQKKAIELYEQAMNMLNSSRPDKKKVYSVLEEAATFNHSKAQEMVAIAHLFGDHLPLNFGVAKNYFDILSEKGNANAQLVIITENNVCINELLFDLFQYLGLMYSIGLGVEPSQAKALIYYTFAASSGNTFAQMALGYRYWSGISVMSSCESALSYYRKVAKRVEEDVSFSGGTVIQRVRLYDELENPGSFSGVLDDDLIQYYQFLADKGDVQAQVGLGQLHYQGGRGVDQDHTRALNYFTQAAEAGNANAMAFLGKVTLTKA